MRFVRAFQSRTGSSETEPLALSHAISFRRWRKQYGASREVPFVITARNARPNGWREEGEKGPQRATSASGRLC
jgi:hypothetical protein